MSEARAAVLVGLLAVVAAALVFVGIASTSKGIGGDDETYAVYGMFSDITGIAAGTKITIAGYPVGQVSAVKLEGEQVRVTLRIRNEIALYAGAKDPATGALSSAAMVQRMQASLLGDAYLELKPGAKGAKLGPGDRVPLVVLETGIAAAMKQLEKVAVKVNDAATIIPKITRIATDIEKITHNAAKVFGSEDGAQRFDEIATNFVKVSRDLASTTSSVKGRLEKGPLAPGGALDRTVKNLDRFAGQANLAALDARGLIKKGGASAQRSLSNVETMTAQLRRIVGANTKGMNETVASLTSTLHKAEQTLGRIDKVVANLETVSGKAARGEGTVGRLLSSDKLINDAETMVSQTKDFVTRFVGLQTAIDFQMNAYGRRLNAGDDAWRSQMTIRIQPTDKRKYYLLGISSDVVPYFDTVTRLQTSGAGGTGTVTESRNELTDVIKFNVQYARRFGALALRGGLIESTAGVGVDLFAAQDRVQLSASVFRLTGPAPAPRLRASLRWAFLSWAYVQVGGDDLLTKQRDGFFGLGISFTDNDLMLLFASSPSVQF